MMTPRDAEIVIEARQKEQDRMMQFQDNMNQLLCVLIAEPNRDPTKRSMSFHASDFTVINPADRVERTAISDESQGMTEEEMESFDRNMNSYRGQHNG